MSRRPRLPDMESPGINAPPIDSSPAGRRRAQRDAERAEREAARLPTKRELNDSIREMVIGTLHALGGQEWLQRQAERFPVCFMGLLAKTMPLEIKEGAGHLRISIVMEMDDGSDPPMAGVLNMPPLRLVNGSGSDTGNRMTLDAEP